MSLLRRVSAMAGFAGFDTDIYPGGAQMGWLKANTNLVWCGYYLAPAPSHDDTSWMGARAALAAQGWGIAPVYLGQQITGPGSHNPSQDQGTTDGNNAADLMDGEGFATGSTVFLDLENGPPMTAPLNDYAGAWCDAVTSRGYQPGIYCSHLIADAVSAFRPAARIWAYKVPTIAANPVAGTEFPTPDPSGSGFAEAVAWQRGQNCQLNLSGAPTAAMTVDLDVATTADPGAP
jgi:hypothetical protein